MVRYSFEKGCSDIPNLIHPLTTTFACENRSNDLLPLAGLVSQLAHSVDARIDNVDVALW